MPYIVINTSNYYEAANQFHHATEEAADLAARDLLAAQPGAVVHMAKVLKRYTAEVTVTVEEPESVGAVEPLEEV